MAKKKKNEPVVEQLSPFQENIRTLKDCFAPSQIDVTSSNTLKIGENYVRNFVMQGYPSYVRVGWLDALYNYQGNLDTVVMVEPSDDRVSVDELNKQIVSLRAQYEQELREGKITNLQAYSDRISMLEEQRRNIELNYESMFNVGIFSNLTSKDEEDLNRRAEMLQADLQGRRANFIPTAYRMINGFKTALPLNTNYFQDKLRNFTTGSLVACMPFIRGEICHPDGVYIGLNEHTGNNVMIDFYDKDTVNNTNISIFGRAGSGKTYFTSLLTMRSALKGVQSLIVDPEGEYSGVVRALGGVVVDLNTDSKSMINPFEVVEEEKLDANDRPTGKYEINLTDKYGDLIDLLCVCAEDVDQEQRSLISSVIVKLYQNFGITTDPNSLFERDVIVDPETGAFYPNGRPKKMPQFSDFFSLLQQEIASKPKSSETEALQRMQNKLKMYNKGEAYPLLDCQSTVNLEALQNAPIVSFDVSGLEESTLRPIGMYVALSYIWDKIVKKNYNIKKRVVCDEAWMLLNQSYPGHQYTSAFLEKCARRIRKRNAGLLVASQNFIEFVQCVEGQAVLNSTAVKMFLKQNETDVDAMQEKFKLSDGERNLLTQSRTGEVLIKTDTESCLCLVQGFPIEHNIITQSRLH